MIRVGFRLGDFLAFNECFRSVCDFKNTETNTLNFVHGFDLGIASLTSKKSSKLPVTINPGIIHFGYKDVIVFFEEFTQTIWKWMDMADIN